MTNALNTLAPQTLAALAKTIADAGKANRSNLEAGEYSVAESVTIDISGTVTVGADYEQRIVGKAKPWNLVAAALELANTQLAAAGVAGIDMAKVIAAAELVDADEVKKAKAQADAQVASRKAPTLTTCKGKVVVKAKAELAAAEVAVAEAA